MPTVTYISHDGNSIDIVAKTGSNLMQEAVNHGVVGIVGECGGAGACATCHCYVDEAWLDKIPPATGSEKDMLEFVASPAHNSRLGCQIKLTEELSGIVVRTPESQY